VSHALEGKVGPDEATNFVFDQLIQRGIIRSELASFFFLADPRTQRMEPRRMIVVAGTGVPGRFGAPEIKIMVRELCWTLHRLRMKNIVTTLIGGGLPSLNIDNVADAWLRGIKDAITGLETSDTVTLSITFVEFDSRKVLDLDEAISRAKSSFESDRRMWIDYTPLTGEECDEIKTRESLNIEAEAKRRISEFAKRILKVRPLHIKKQDASSTAEDGNRESAISSTADASYSTNDHLSLWCAHQ
jgi:hypothetical protein